MRAIVSQAQINQFRSRGFVELSDLFTADEVATLSLQLDEAKKNGAPSYDIQRKFPSLTQAMKLPRCARLVGSLSHESRLILAFSKYPPAYAKKGTLEEISSFSEVVGGLLLNLTGEGTETMDLLPKQLGSATCLSTEMEIDFPAITQPYLLLVFAKESARYRKTETDPHTHEGKKMGYGFGDILSPLTHARFSCD